MKNECTAIEIQCMAAQDEARYAYSEARYHLEQGFVKRALLWQAAAYGVHKVMTKDLDHLTE